MKYNSDKYIYINQFLYKYTSNILVIWYYRSLIQK